ncbi:MAG: hypothetical protein NC131_14065 [Roseburia sp.]|nr:hypothetical protein [Roseburia sp.]
MNISIAIQFTIVGIIVLGAFVWLFILLKKRSKGESKCCGCALNEVCDPKKKGKATNDCSSK